MIGSAVPVGQDAAPIPKTVTATLSGHLTTYTYTIWPLPSPTQDTTTWDTPIPTTVTTTIDGHLTTYTSTIFPFPTAAAEN